MQHLPLGSQICFRHMVFCIDSQAGESRRVLITVYDVDSKASISCQTLAMVRRKQQNTCVQMGSRKFLFTMSRWKTFHSVLYCIQQMS